MGLEPLSSISLKPSFPAIYNLLSFSLTSISVGSWVNGIFCSNLSVLPSIIDTVSDGDLPEIYT